MEFDLADYIMHHMVNSKEWHLPFFPPIQLPGFLTLHGLMVILCAVFLIVLFCLVYRKHERVPTGITNCLEVFVLFVRDEISIACLGAEGGRKMAPFFCTVFFFILGMNLMGLIPIFATATANINVTAALALITLGFMIFGTIYLNGIKVFFKALMPSGVPGPILVILMPIEFVSLFIKSFALTIRLFANLLAGHIVIFSILGIVVIVGLAALPAILLALFIYLLEILVAFLQAYIFTFLSAMFIGQVLVSDH